MKKFIWLQALSLLLMRPGLCQFSFKLNESTWMGSHSPTVAGTKLLFFGDTMALLDQEGIREPELFFYKESHDTLVLNSMESASITCMDQGPGIYLIQRSNNGEKIHFKPLQDACMARFNRLLAEAPWIRKRENGEWRPDWHFLSPENDYLAGVSLYEAYRLVRFRQPQPIIVAIIDSPIDYNHPDLKPVMWQNPGEIPGNKKDDDGNWYRDDIYGWFFNAGKDGKIVDTDHPEATQVYQLFSRRFEGREEKNLRQDEKADWKVWQRAKAVFEKEQKRAQDLKMFFSDSLRLFSALQEMRMQAPNLKTAGGIDSCTFADKEYGTALKQVLKEIYLNQYPGFDSFIRILRRDFPVFRNSYQNTWTFDYNPESFPRAPVQDHPENPKERMYGCGFLKNPESEAHGHGTHCAGIIAGKRDNGIGIDGVANKVQIMSLSAVPSSGDERDKDVANAIRYAAEKGAKIISMSFAKRFSPHKKVVDDAIRFAESKGCLFFHAAGNYHLNRDTATFYPVPDFQQGGRAKNWIEVGNNRSSMDENLVAPSSNYGRKTVDLFAPGTEILSTYPGGKYEIMSGTSMACPLAAGVAAFIWSYFPKLKAADVKKVLMESVYKPDLKVKKPGSKELVPFSTLSVSGGIVNARQAVVLADELNRKKGRK